MSTGLADLIIERTGQLAQRTGVRVRLIGLDHLMLISGGEVNNNEHAAAVLKEAARIAAHTGAAVNILAHTPKAAAAKEEPDQHDVLGAVASVNLARWTCIVRRLRPADAKDFGIREEERHRYARVVVVKSNSTPMGLEYFVRADFNPVYEAIALTQVELTKAKDGPSKTARKLLAVLGRLEDKQGRAISSTEWRAQAEKDGISRSSFFRLAAELREAELVIRDDNENYRSMAADLGEKS